MTALTPYNYLEAALTGKSLNATNQRIDFDHIRTLTGRLIFQDDQQSAENTKIKFFVKDVFNVSHYVGSAYTDRDGNFLLEYTWKPGWLDRSHHIVMGIVENHLPFKQEGLLFKKEVTLEKIEKVVALKDAFHNLGVIPIQYANISRNFSTIGVPTASHMQPPSYFLKLFKALLPELSKKIFIKLFRPWMTVERVQNIYDSYGPAYLKRVSSPQNLIYELLNHITATDFTISGNTVTWAANWDGLKFDRSQSLPNVRVVASKSGHDSLTLDYIAIKFREDSQETLIKPEDANIDWAIYLARSSFALKGEAELHLAEGHILPGIPSKVFFKHIKPQNPLFAPIEPHLSQLDFINWFGSRGIIFGTGSVLDASALNEKSIEEVIIKHIRHKADWLNYTPATPITSFHYHAKAEHLHFNILLSFFERYIENHKEKIVEHWSSIFNWSEGIHQLIETFPKITENRYTPSEEDFKRLAKCIAWLITKTTFTHWAAHSRQQLLTDIRQLSLAVEKRSLDEQGNFQPHGNTSVNEAMQQVHVARILMNFEGDSIFKDPNGDMDKDLLRELRKQLEKYEGYDDIIDMHLTTQI